MSTAFIPSTTVRREISVHYANGFVLKGDLEYYPGQEALVLVDEETGMPERLSVNLGHYGLYPRPGHVFIKDWTEGEGVTASLVESGVVELVDSHEVGPYGVAAHEVKVLV